MFLSTNLWRSLPSRSRLDGALTPLLASRGQSLRLRRDRAEHGSTVPGGAAGCREWGKWGWWTEYKWIVLIIAVNIADIQYEWNEYDVAFNGFNISEYWLFHWRVLIRQVRICDLNQGNGWVFIRWKALGLEYDLKWFHYWGWGTGGKPSDRALQKVWETAEDLFYAPWHWRTKRC